MAFTDEQMERMRDVADHDEEDGICCVSAKDLRDALYEIRMLRRLADSDRARGRADERASVVAWLRDPSVKIGTPVTRQTTADAITSGSHALKRETDR